MNRLTAYFDNARLAKLELVEAKEQAAKNQLWKSQVHMAKAVEYLLAAQNCIASIAFNKRPKK